MGICDSVIVGGAACEGHLGKFDSCLAEALHGWTLDESYHERDDATGDSDFEGHVTAIIVERGEDVTIDPDGVARTVRVPAGNYLVFVASSGAVTLAETSTAQEAREIVRVNADRYHAWERGCDPDCPAEHEQCQEYDECQRGCESHRSSVGGDAGRVVYCDGSCR